MTAVWKQRLRRRLKLLAMAAWIIYGLPATLQNEQMLCGDAFERGADCEDKALCQ